jgi:[Skp1-protein]-hydroxyproline N-acetylglucosaminyltransferase
MQSPTNGGQEETIFVSIPSYRDPECQWTVKDLFAKAKYPNRIYVGICWQINQEQDAHCFEEPHPYPDQVRVINLDWTEARGPCFARFHSQRLFRGEDYYLSIDSHTRFTKDWDDRLIKLLKKCPSPKPIITGYPAGYELPNKIPADKRPPFLCVKGFGTQDRMLRLHGRLLKRCSAGTVLPSLFWVAGFSFSRGEMINEVPYDPHVPFIFFGEESSMSARLWTHGYDLFAPCEHFVYHLWRRDYRPNFREVEDKTKLQQRSLTRVRLLLGMLEEHEKETLEPEVTAELDRYGLGNYEGRTLAKFQEHAGVNFKDCTAEERTLWGGQDKELFVDGMLEKVMALAGLSITAPSRLHDGKETSAQNEQNMIGPHNDVETDIVIVPSMNKE